MWRDQRPAAHALCCAPDADRRVGPNRAAAASRHSMLKATRDRAAEVARRPVRRALDGLSARIVAGLAPRIERLVETRHAPDDRHQGFFEDAHNLIHALRTTELSCMPPGAQVLLSAGCSGRWYFDWIEGEYGRLATHIGVERYLQRPEDLPDNAQWIEASVANMPEVADASVDLLFSGQNIEHLFGDDLVDFLVEASRVVKPSGHLVIDSPNREIANLLVWSMSEHTIELTPDEARELVTLAGFDVSSITGVWLCRDARTGAILPYDPFSTPRPPLETVRRIALGHRRPEDCAIWWLEAKRTTRPPDVATMRRLHAEIFRVAWPERQNRLLNLIGTVRLEDGVRVAAATAVEEGCLMHGPYMPLSPGGYRVRMTIRRLGDTIAPSRRVARLDVVAQGGESPTLALRDVRAEELRPGIWTQVEIPFTVASLRWGGEYRVYAVGGCAIEARMEVELDDEGSAVYPTGLRGSAAAARR
jgi:SAM-dependent methyltransferase